MKVLREGHRYILDSMEGTNPQQLQFIEKEMSPDGSGFTTVYDGTTNEEVIRVLIDRIGKLNEKNPCTGNIIVLDRLEGALTWLENRTQRRIKQGVEGTPKPHKS